MSFEEEFDKKIRLKMDEAAFPFNPADWEKASAMIDASRGAGAVVSNAKKWYLPAALLGVAAIGLAIYFWPVANIAEVKNLADNKISEPAQTESAPVQTHNLNAGTSAGNRPDLLNTVASEPNAKANESQMLSSDAGNNSQPQSKTNSPAISESVNKENSTEEIRKKKINKEIKEISAVLKANKRIGHLATQPVLPTNLPIAQRDKMVEDAPGTSSKESDGNAPQPNQPYSNNQNEVSKDGAETNTQLNIRPVNTEEVVNEDNSLAIYVLQQSGIYQPYLPAELIQTKFVLLKRYDEDYYRAPRPKKYFVNAEAGTLFNFGWQAANGVTDGRGLNWYGGINYAHYLTKKTAAGIGIQLFNLANTNQPFYKTEGRQYSFYSITTGTTLTSINLTFLALPFKFYYIPDKHQQLGLGLTPIALLRANTEQLTYTQNQDINSVTNTSKVKGIYENVNQYSLLGSLFYKYNINKTIAISAKYNYGFSDLFKNNELINNSEQVHGIRLGIVFTFIR